VDVVLRTVGYKLQHVDMGAGGWRSGAVECTLHLVIRFAWIELNVACRLEHFRVLKAC
jgi:hypothetical protein